MDRIDDIALFFSDEGGKKQQCWVSHEVYADPNFFLGPVDATLQDAVVLVDKAGVYKTNLANLKPPGEITDGVRSLAAKTTKKSAKKTTKKPVPGDLIVVPFSDPDNAYLVPKSRYTDEGQCPPISALNGADLSFMAITEGVVLANLPKIDLAGMTCYLLNLLALRPTQGAAKKP